VRIIFEVLRYRCRRNAKTYTPMYKSHLEFQIRSAAKTPPVYNDKAVRCICLLCSSLHCD